MSSHDCHYRGLLELFESIASEPDMQSMLCAVAARLKVVTNCELLWVALYAGRDHTVGIQRIDSDAADGIQASELSIEQRYPEIIFAPQSVILRQLDSGDSQVKVQGILTLHGANHPIELSLSVHENDREVALSGSFTIPYVAWGLKDPSLLLFRAGKNVAVAISCVGRLGRPTQ